MGGVLIREKKKMEERLVQGRMNGCGGQGGRGLCVSIEEEEKMQQNIHSRLFVYFILFYFVIAGPIQGRLFGGESNKLFREVTCVQGRLSQKSTTYTLVSLHRVSAFTNVSLMISIQTLRRLSWSGLKSCQPPQGSHTFLPATFYLSLMADTSSIYISMQTSTAFLAYYLVQE